MTKSVAILGCGPAGLLVAHAAELSGWNFRIYSRKKYSNLYGAQYLHAAIPGLDTGNPQTVRYRLTGSPSQYRQKVYGPEWDGTVSPEDLMESHYAWNLRDTYDKLWIKYQSEIWDMDLHKSLFEVTTPWSNGSCDLVISTVPRKIWAMPGDVFESTKVWALGDTEMPRVDKPYRPEPFTVMCDGRPQVPWYRVANIFGYCTIEWPCNPEVDFELMAEDDHAVVPIRYKYKPPHSGASLVEKPLRHNSKAAADFIHLGRYGAWQKGVLTSDAFFEAMKVLANDHV